MCAYVANCPRNAPYDGLRHAIEKTKLLFVEGRTQEQIVDDSKSIIRRRGDLRVCKIDKRPRGRGIHEHHGVDRRARSAPVPTRRRMGAHIAQHTGAGRRGGSILKSDGKGSKSRSGKK